MAAERDPSKRCVTRREFILRVSRHGSAAVLASMFALDLLARDAGGFRLDGRAPATKGRRIVILGGGVAGLATAYELGRIGYDCVLLEARPRPGGRNWTIRRGTEETELAGDRQVCRFDKGLFFNAGPMRISHHHESTLNYCREFGLPLVVFPNVNEAAFVHREGFPKLRLREVDADLRGYTSELLAKVIKKGDLDAPLSPDVREKFIEYLRAEGRLDASLIYPRTGLRPDSISESEDTRGYTTEPGVAELQRSQTPPMDLELLVKAGYGFSRIKPGNYSQQPTMLTPAGGIDRIPFAFAQRLKGVIRYRSEVREVRRTSEGGVRIVYADLAHGGVMRTLTADFCVCTLPPPILARLPADFSADTSGMLKQVKPGKAGKIGLQFKHRFWEQDEGIYGGVSRTDLPIQQIYYPFDEYGSPGKGIVIGYYHFGEAEAELDAQSFQERERRALMYGAKIHAQYPAEFENSFSVAWQRIPHSEMPWVDFGSEDQDFERIQSVLGKPDGPFYFAGDWRSQLNGWMAGAFASAHQVCREIHAHANSIETTQN